MPIIIATPYRSTSFDIANSTYDSVSKSVSPSTYSAKVQFKPDGTKMYILDFLNGTNSVHQFTLSLAWDLSTATYDSVALSLSGQGQQFAGLAFGDSGSKMYVVTGLTDTMFQYTISTPWDLSTGSYSGTSLSVTGGDNTGILFRSSTIMYVSDTSGSDKIYQHPLTTPWIISSSTGGSNVYNTGTSSIWDLEYNSTGTKLFVLDRTSRTIEQHSLSTPYDISTASSDGTSFNVENELNNPLGFSFSSDMSKMYVVGDSNIVYQYSI